MRRLLILLFCNLFIISLSVTMSLADEKLDSMKSIYDREISKIDDQYISDMADIQKVYFGRIDAALKKATDSGDLATYDKIDEEKKRFQEEKTIPANTSVQGLLDKAELKKNASVVNLSKKYIAGLNNLKISLMRAKDIQGARDIQAVIDNMEAVIATLKTELVSRKGSEVKAPAKITKSLFSKPKTADATLYITCDNSYVVWLNGKRIGSGSNFNKLDSYNVEIRAGDLLAIEAMDLEGGRGSGALYCCMVLNDNKKAWGIDRKWHAATIKPPEGWQKSRDMKDFKIGLSEHYASGAHAGRADEYRLERPELLGHFLWSEIPKGVFYVKELVSWDNFVSNK